MKKLNIHKSAIVDKGAKIGLGTSVWHFSHVMPKAIIGKNCILGQNVFVANEVEIGDGVKIQNNVSLYTGLIIEDDCFIGPSVVFTNVINPRSFIERKTEFKKTLIKKGASIGANSTIICGNTIGEYSLIGAGSVITKDIPDFALVVGNPGKIIGWVSKEGEKLNFSSDGICKHNGVTYKLENSLVSVNK